MNSSDLLIANIKYGLTKDAEINRAILKAAELKVAITKAQERRKRNE